MSSEAPTKLSFVVPGEPVGKARARARVVRTKTGGAFASFYTPAQTRAYEEGVRLVCQAAVARVRWAWSPKDRFALSIHVYRKHEGAGSDLDNYVKAASDAINGVAFPDDRYVRELVATLAQDAERPRVEVVVTRIRVGEGRRVA